MDFESIDLSCAGGEVPGLAARSFWITVNLGGCAGCLFA